MRGHGLLPDGGVALPLEYRDPPPLHPKYKAAILYFMYFAEKAANKAEGREAHVLHSSAHIAASALLQKVYDIHVHAEPIKDYYLNVLAKAQEVGDWDEYALGRIMSSQLQDYDTSSEVISFFSKAGEHWNHLTLIEKFFLQKISNLADGTKGKPLAFIRLTAFMYGIITSDHFHFPDPEFKQPHDMRLETSDQYHCLRDLEKWLKESSSFIPDT